MNDDLKAIIERLKAGTQTTDDVQLLRRALQAGQIAIASGEDSVALTDSNGNTIFTGDILFKGEDMAAQQALAALLQPRLHQLPSDLSDFTGREQEIKDLMKVMAEGNGRVAMGGMGGVGKTALAVHVAHR